MAFKQMPPEALLSINAQHIMNQFPVNPDKEEDILQRMPGHIPSEVNRLIGIDGRGSTGICHIIRPTRPECRIHLAKGITGIIQVEIYGGIDIFSAKRPVNDQLRLRLVVCCTVAGRLFRIAGRITADEGEKCAGQEANCALFYHPMKAVYAHYV